MTSADDQDAADAAVMLSPAGLLRQLADAAAAAPGERPDISLHLTGGQVLSGTLLRAGAERDHGADHDDAESVVLADRSSGSFRYALLASVSAVDVHNPGAFRDVITGGGLPPRSGRPPASRLALQREFAPAEDFPVQVDWDGLPDSSQARATLHQLLTALREVIIKVRADDMGRQALAQAGTLTVGHSAGSQPGVRRVPGGLLVQADLLAALPRVISPGLFHDLSAVL